MPVLGLMVLMLFSVLVLIFYLNLKYNAHHESFEIASRYFIFLAGVGVVAVPWMGVELWQIFSHDQWMKINVVIGLGGLLILRLIRTYAQVSGAGIY